MAVPAKLSVFPPWFLTRETMRKIEALLPYFYHTRFRFYFDRYGCIRCSRKNVVYCASGLCLSCQGLINDRLRRTDQAMKRRYGSSPDVPCKRFMKRWSSARELLADIRAKRYRNEVHPRTRHP